MIYDKIQKLLNNASIRTSAPLFLSKLIVGGIILSLGMFFILIGHGIFTALISGVVVFLTIIFGAYTWLFLSAINRIKKIEDLLPDFLALMASNIKSGLTPDRAFLLSARKEFGPLAEEIDIAAKETIAGTSFADAFMNMTHRIDSEMFAKTVRLIVEGVNSGGNLGNLLEDTSLDLRRFKSIRKDVSATVLVYELFIFAAVGFGGPLLYSVAYFLIDMVSKIRSNLHINTDISAQMPMMHGTTALNLGSVFIFAIAAIGVTVFFGALTAGSIVNGKESDGIKYIPILGIVAYAVFFIGLAFLNMVLGGMVV